MKLKKEVTNIFGQKIPSGSKIKILHEHEGDVYIVPQDTDLRGAWVKKEDVQ